MDRYESWDVTKAAGAMCGMFGGTILTFYGMVRGDIETASAGMSMLYKSNSYLFSDGGDLENRSNDSEHPV